MKLALALCLAAFVAGIAIVLTTGGLLGPILIVGAIGAIGWMVVPGLIDTFAHLLSTGTFRRHS